MTMTPSSRKRKRGLLDEEYSDSLSIGLSSLSDTQVGPVLGVLYCYFQASVLVAAYLPCILSHSELAVSHTPQKHRLRHLRRRTRRREGVREVRRYSEVLFLEKRKLLNSLARLMMKAMEQGESLVIY